MPRATSSLPVPLSPRISTVLLTGEICTTRSSTCSISSVSPTMPVISRNSSRCTSRRPTSATSSGSMGLAKQSEMPSWRHTSRPDGSVASVRPMMGTRPRSRACAMSWRARRSRRPPVITSSSGSFSASATDSPGASSSTRIPLASNAARSRTAGSRSSVVISTTSANGYGLSIE